MPAFHVRVLEIHVGYHEVEAPTVEEALRKVENDFTSESSCDYSHRLPRDTWTVDNAEGEVVRYPVNTVCDVSG